MNNELIISEVTDWSPEELESLAELLVEVVTGGAAIGFLPPLTKEDADAYWCGVHAPEVRVWVARYQGEIVGTVQLHLCTRTNGLHRAEIAKLMVSPRARRMGAARRLMNTAEQRAILEGRTLLVLDTREGDVSNDLYRSLGFVEAGRIPNYARSATGELHTTVVYYKLLDGADETK